jgi:hypothetical protein
VPSAQRELGKVVIELRFRPNWLPTHGGVAVLACDIQRAVRATAVGVGLRLSGSYRAN